MKRLYMLLLISAAIALSGCDGLKQTSSKDSSTNTDVSQNKPTTESVSKIIDEIESKLKQTQDLLIKRTAERDSYQTEFLQLCRGRDKTPKEIELECMKNTSDIEQFSWFFKARTAWINWKAVEKDVIVFSRQKTRLEKTLQKLQSALAQLKRIEENRKVYIPGEDPELDEKIIEITTSLEFDNYDNLSSVEQALIDEEVNKTMTEMIEKKVSVIPNLELKSINELPTLPDFAALIDEPTDDAQQSVYKTVLNKCDSRIKAAQKDAKDFIEKKRPEIACDVWLNCIDELNEIILAWSKLDDNGKNKCKKYLDALETCHLDTLRFMSKPYRNALNDSVRSLENADRQDWNKIIESLEGLVNIHPKLIPLMAKEMDGQWKKIGLQLKLLKELNDFDADVIQQRLTNVVSKCPDEIKHYFPDIEESIRKAEAENLYKQAVGLRIKANYSDALVRINEALELYPNDVNYLKEKQIIELTVQFSRADRKAGDRTVMVINGVEFAFRYCPPGTFWMGSPSSESGRDKDEKQHQVTLREGFWMMETEVTQKQWKAVMGNNPSKFKGDDLPVEMVSWNDCREFCKKCAQLALPVQLPTEAQWEYACRAGSAGVYADSLNDTAWYKSRKTRAVGTRSVGTKKPNVWGLYDMHGNVREWCQDWYGSYPVGKVTDPVGPSTGSNRVVRGGSWYNNAQYCRSAYRNYYDPANRYYYLGFRCVIDK